AVPAILIQDFGLALPLQFACPAIPLAADAAKRPAESRPALLHPISSLAVRHDAAPERPAPAMPQPALVPLAYHCHGTAGTPAKGVGSQPSRPRLALPRFAVPLALPEPWELDKPK